MCMCVCVCVCVCTIIATQVTVVFAGLIVETSIPCHPSLSLIWKYHCICTCLNTHLTELYSDMCNIMLVQMYTCTNQLHVIMYGTGSECTHIVGHVHTNHTVVFLCSTCPYIYTCRDIR